jgi:cell division protein FtsL
MTRLGAVFWFVVVLVAGFTTFKVKYAVQDIEDQLSRVRRQTMAEQQEIRVLTAEWTYLTQPERLADLNRRFLGLAPIAAKQLQRTIADIPLRAPAAPAGLPDVPPDVPSDVLTRVSTDPVAPPTPAPAAVTPPAAPVPASTLPAPPAVPAPAALGPAEARPAARVQLAKAGTAPAPGSLDALVAQIADTR